MPPIFVCCVDPAGGKSSFGIGLPMAVGRARPFGGIMAPTHPGCAADPIETPGEESIHAHSHPVRFRPAGADRKSPFNGCRRKPGRSTFSVEAAAPNTKKNVFDLFAHVGAH
jgi:hypothetical protein